MDRVTHLRGELNSTDAGRVLVALNELAKLGPAAKPALNDLYRLAGSCQDLILLSKIRQTAITIYPPTSTISFSGPAISLSGATYVDLFATNGKLDRDARMNASSLTAAELPRVIDGLLQEMREWPPTGVVTLMERHLRQICEVHPAGIEIMATALWADPLLRPQAVAVLQYVIDGHPNEVHRAILRHGWEQDTAVRTAIIEVLAASQSPKVVYLIPALDAISGTDPADHDSDGATVQLIAKLAAASPSTILAELANEAERKPSQARLLATVLEYTRDDETYSPAAIAAVYSRALCLMADHRPAARAFAAHLISSCYWLQRVDPALIRSARDRLMQASGDERVEVREIADWAPHEMDRVLGERDPRHDANNTA
jgi:hypothetical protein